MKSAEWDAAWLDLMRDRLDEDERHQWVLDVLDERQRELMMHQPFKPIITEKTL